MHVKKFAIRKIPFSISSGFFVSYNDDEIQKSTNFSGILIEYDLSYGIFDLISRRILTLIKHSMYLNKIFNCNINEVQFTTLGTLETISMLSGLYVEVSS